MESVYRFYLITYRSYIHTFAVQDVVDAAFARITTTAQALGAVIKDTAPRDIAATAVMLFDGSDFSGIRANLSWLREASSH